MIWPDIDSHSNRLKKICDSSGLFIITKISIMLMQILPSLLWCHLMSRTSGEVSLSGIESE